VLDTAKLIAEPWDCGPGGYQVGGFPPGWAEWNDKFRDTVRDFWRGEVPASELAPRLCASSDAFNQRGRKPWACVNFVTAHDGFTRTTLSLITTSTTRPTAKTTTTAARTIGRGIAAPKAPVKGHNPAKYFGVYDVVRLDTIWLDKS
jgi:hypothetical protein